MVGYTNGMKQCNMSQHLKHRGFVPQTGIMPTDAEWCILENFVDTGAVSCTDFGWRGTDAGNHLKGKRSGTLESTQFRSY